MKSNRKPLVESLESRRVLAASLGWDGPGAGSADLTYHISNAPSSLSQPQVVAAIETALSAWSNVADITFTPTSRSGLRDSLDISFRNLDGPGGVLAQAYFPGDVNSARVAGDIEFDSSELWEVGNGLGRTAFDLVAVAVHEIGHALGLDHIREAGSILLPSISPSQVFSGLSADDVAAIRELYAPARSGSAAGSTGVEAAEASTPVAESAEPTSSDPLPRRNPWQNWRWTQRFGFWWGRFGRLEASANEGHNAARPTDVNGDSFTSPVDVLLIINTLNSGAISNSVHRCDTNNDGAVSPVDALLVINTLNRSAPGSPADDPAVPEPTGEGDEPLSGELDEPAGDAHAGDQGDVGEQPDIAETRFDKHHFGSFLGLPDFGRLGIGSRHGLLNEQTVDRAFAALDDNVDGSLGRDELPRFAWEYLGRQGVDLNENELITLQELSQYLAAQRLERFQELDASGDGLLDQSEVSELRWARLENADIDADQQISFDELESFLALSRFDQVDDNRNGHITAEEVSEHFWRFLVRFDGNNDALITADEFPDSTGVQHQHEVLDRIADRLADVARRLRQNIRSLRMAKS